MPLTILVADDDPGIRLSVSDYLELSGYSVIAAENGKKALEMIEQYQPHLIVTDITMPQMDGYELMRRVRQRPAFRLLPVVFLTARTETQERIRGYQLGCDLYLPKPFDLDELGAVIRNLLDRVQIVQSEWRLRAQGKDPGEAEMLEMDQLALTQREKDVLKRLADGLSNAQIGDRLHLSPRTIEKYVSSLLQKTETSNRAELVRFAIERHLVE
jgi:DNA-binding NarL/FixJ family response regulator